MFLDLGFANLNASITDEQVKTLRNALASNAKPYHSLNFMAGRSVGKLQGTLPFGGAGRKTLSYYYIDHGFWIERSALSRLFINKQKEKITTKNRCTMARSFA